MATINLKDFSSPDTRIFSGRPRGEAAREKADLNVLDKAEGQVKIIFPETTWSINSSFFLGMFQKSINTLGEKAFRDKYQFEGPMVEKAVEYGIAAALNTSSPLPTKDNPKLAHAT